MFIEQYNLERTPFAPDAVRPMFSSYSMRYAAAKVNEVVARQAHCLFLSGPKGVGKTAFVRHRFRGARDATISWIPPNAETKEDVLAHLLEDVGPGAVEGTPNELRKILEVYLRHEAAKGHVPFIIIDALERLSAAALREFEALSQLKVKNRPVVHLLFLTSNEELVTNLLPLHDSGPLARAVHQRLTGFSLDETRAYVRTCLRGAGCEWAEELVSDEVLNDIQAFTQGVVGDTNALCRTALDAVAARSGNHSHPKMTRALVKEAGQALNLRYDPAAWEPVAAEPLSATAVHLSDPNELHIEAARLIVSSGRAVVAEVSLTRPRMVLGRDESCDISLDSRYVSRYQNLFMETPEGWMLIDLSSTNGCFVNGKRVREHRLRDGDLIAVGHHQLRFAGPAAPSEKPQDATAELPADRTIPTPRQQIR
jgi:type II secretory pathway predicted ATPase ExeA